MARRTLRVDFVGERLYNDGERIVAPRIPAGVDFSFSIQINEDGAEKDLTGFSADCQVRMSARSATVVLEPTVNITAGVGQVTLHVAGSDSAAHAGFRGVYDVRLRNQSDVVVARLMEGVFEIDQQVTRDG